MLLTVSDFVGMLARHKQDAFNDMGMSVQLRHWPASAQIPHNYRLKEN